ncbi:hypothetical protein Tco_0453443 [Tanacetum coccineum]
MMGMMRICGGVDGGDEGGGGCGSVWLPEILPEDEWGTRKFKWRNVNAHIKRQTKRKLERLDQEVAVYLNGSTLLA